MNFKKFVPSDYKKSVLDINYKELEKKGIKYILFDLDNTLAIIKENKVPKDIEELLRKLKKKFKIVIVSNNFKRRIKPICDIIDVEFISFSMKPFIRKINKFIIKNNLKKEEICIIGDQLISDVLTGYRLGITNILVDPLGTKDLKVTKINRFLENKILKKLKNQKLLERGIYYE